METRIKEAHPLGDVLIMLKDRQWLRVRIDKVSGLLTFSLFERKYGILWCYKQAFITIIDTPEVLSFILERLQLKLTETMQREIDSCRSLPLAIIDHGGEFDVKNS